MSNSVTYRRIYDEPQPGDGHRVLVDRVWPRGIRRDAAAFDEWLPEIAPSPELRKWYGHDPERFAEFARRYRAELAQPEPAAELARLRQRAREQTLTLLTATKNPDLSQAAVLAEQLSTG